MRERTCTPGARSRAHTLACGRCKGVADGRREAEEIVTITGWPVVLPDAVHRRPKSAGRSRLEPSKLLGPVRCWAYGSGALVVRSVNGVVADLVPWVSDVDNEHTQEQSRSSPAGAASLVAPDCMHPWLAAFLVSVFGQDSHSPRGDRGVCCRDPSFPCAFHVLSAKKSSVNKRRQNAT